MKNPKLDVTANWSLVPVGGDPEGLLLVNQHSLQRREGGGGKFGSLEIDPVTRALYLPIAMVPVFRILMNRCTFQMPTTGINGAF